MQATAVVIIHSGYRYELLELAALAARRACGDTCRICLITDQPNFFISKHSDIELYDITELEADIADKSAKLNEVFRNDGPNQDLFEKFCFRRFLLLDAFFEKAKVDRALNIDADLLLFRNPLEAMHVESDQAYIVHHTSTYFSFWNRKTIADFAAYILGPYFKTAPNLWRICDMDALYGTVERHRSDFVVAKGSLGPYENFSRDDCGFREFLVKWFGDREGFQRNPVTGFEKLPPVPWEDLDEHISWSEGKPMLGDVALPFVHLQGDTKRYAPYFADRSGLRELIK